MGSSYDSITVKGPEQAQIAAFLEAMGQSAFLTPTRDSVTVVACRDLQTSQGFLAHRLSKELICTVWCVLVHDSDVMHYSLYQKGSLVDDFNSDPGWGWSDEYIPARGGNAEALCAAFGANDTETIEKARKLLTVPKSPTTVAGFDTDWEARGGYAFAEQRHADLVTALGLPELPYDAEYGDFETGILSVGFSSEELAHVAGKPERPYRQYIVVAVPEDMDAYDVFEQIVEQSNPDFAYKLGARTEVRNKLQSLVPEADFSDRKYGWFEGEGYALEFDFGSLEIATHLILLIYDDYESGLPIFERICISTGWRAMPINGDWLEFG